MRVILADDSGLILERLEEMISLNKQVEIIGSYMNGKDTLQALRKLKPDLAIVDLKMPGLSGLQVLTEIRHEDKALKFIILTFCSSEYYRQLALNIGADYFFSKVEDFEKVSLVLNEMVLKEMN
ncbi:MAG: response regulator transcription factor [Bacteroidota bacterium]